ncbi:MAG TPA: DUF3566 domain-containing protein [Actinomycetota bacterium]|nr:DUF3566 domain-containing protein [Actinomycetota bacterium]
MATVQTKPATKKPKAASARRIRVSVRKISPWSVLRISLVFYFCLMLVILFGLGILYVMLNSIGVLDSIAELLGSVGFGDGTFEFNAGSIFRTLFLIGFITVIVGSVFTAFLAFLYNLISDLVGGIELTLVERR